MSTRGGGGGERWSVVSLGCHECTYACAFYYSNCQNKMWLAACKTDASLAPMLAAQVLRLFVLT